MTLAPLLKDIRACTVCAQSLPLGPRPVITVTPAAKLMIIGQAPGTRVHESGVPWDDRSGERLRDWLQMSAETFYDETKVAILPMGMCYPGVNKNGGDLPPRPECAPLWHGPVLSELPNIKLTLLVGMYAQKYYLRKTGYKTLTETVANYAEYLPDILPLPHPSWRTTGWQKKNEWYDAQLLPLLRRRVAELVS